MEEMSFLYKWGKVRFIIYQFEVDKHASKLPEMTSVVTLLKPYTD